MKTLYTFLLVGLSFAALTSCGTKKEKKEDGPEIMWNEMEMVPDTVTFDLTKPKVFHASETIFTDLVHTKLEVSFDWAKSQMNGKATVTAKPHFYAQDSLILDAKGMEIKTVQLDGKNLNYAYDSSFLRIKLNKTYTRDEKYTIVVDYIAKPDERLTSGSAAITSDKGLYFINPKGEEKGVMPQIWTQGETEASSVWFPTIDAPNVKTTQEIFITVDKKYATLSNGKLVKSTENANGTRTDHWKQDLPHAPYLFMMGIGEFKVVKDWYTRPDGTKMEVNYYVEPEWEQYARAIFGETPAMIKFFSELTGVEYPWDKYSQIVVRDYVSGAMENTGAVIFGDFAYKTDRELLDEDDNSTIAHELFHHWFGDLVTCESWSNLSLNESFANYSQYLWDEHRYGLDEADYQAEGEKRGYYQSVKYGAAHNLIWYDYNDKEQMFDGHSYNKGGRILHMLRNYLGDEAFFAGLKLYLKTNQFKAADFHHLQHAFEEVSGRDLTFFFQQWYEGKNHPLLDISYRLVPEKNAVEMNVIQNQDLGTTPLYQLPVKVMVYDDAGEHLHDVTVREMNSTFSFPVQGTLKNIIFDYQQCILGELNEDKKQEYFIHQFYNGKRYLAKTYALQNGTKKMTAEAQKMVIDALSDPFWDIRRQAISYASQLTESNLNEATNKITSMLKSDPKSAVRASAFEYLSQILSSVELEKLCLDRVRKDQSYEVVGSALGLLVEKNVNLAVKEAQKMEELKSDKIKSTIAQVYASSGKPELFPYLEKILLKEKLAGYDAIIAMNSYTVFTTKQNLDFIEKAPAFYKSLYQEGSMYTKMFMPQNLTYFEQFLGQRMNDNLAAIEAAEKAKDMLLADNLRRENKRLDAISKEIAAFKKSIEKKNEEH